MACPTKFADTKTTNLRQSHTISIHIHERIFDIEDEWGQLAKGEIFLSPEYLNVLEKFPPSQIKPYYATVMQAGITIGIILFQSKFIKLSENLRLSPNDAANIGQQLQVQTKNWLLRQVNFYSICCGNMTLTGEYGFKFTDDVPKNSYLKIINDAIQKLEGHLTKENKKVGLILIKDFESSTLLDDVAKNYYTMFKVQPKMSLKIEPKWTNFDDYCLDLKSKYRVRWRKALERKNGITKRELLYADLKALRSEIYHLYRHVSDEASFNTFVLNDDYFYAMKMGLHDKFRVFGYFEGEKIVAFYTTVGNNDILNAHFLGYDPEKLLEYDLYLNILYDLIDDAIEQKYKVLDLSRTAIEIKSSVGAKPQDLYLYIKHNNCLVNTIVNPILNILKPSDEYNVRSPFVNS